MKRRYILCLIALILFSACCLPAFAEQDAPDAWNLTFETDDVLAAAKEVCLIYGGQGSWEKGQVQTVGCVVLRQNESEDKIELALYTARSVYDCSSGSPQRIAGGLKPVKLIFEKDGNGFRLLSYQKPEDGAKNAASQERIFGKALHLDIAKRQFEYAELALQDAAEDADDYITYLQTNKKTRVWYEFLPSGTQPKARQIVLSAVSAGYPSYSGVSAGYRPGRLYTLSVEGEQSYSGILTFRCFDATGNPLESFTVQVIDGELHVLDGTLPELEYE